MELPQGYIVKGECPPNTKLVCKLNKSLYGLKQASKQWNAKLTTTILKYGFKQSSLDYSLFAMKTSNEDFIALLVYVDDTLIGNSSYQETVRAKEFLNSDFKLKDLGNVKYFLVLKLQNLLKVYHSVKGSMLWIF